MKGIIPNSTPVRLTYEKKLMAEILNGLERIITSKVEWKENQLEMAGNVIVENQKIAEEIKRKLIEEHFTFKIQEETK